MQIAHGLLILGLIDVVAAASDLDGDDRYQELRTKIGNFVVENRVPSKPEFDSLSEDLAGLRAEYTGDGNDVQRYEDPASHIAPAGLKSDLLRTNAAPAPAGEPALRATPVRDPYALEVQRADARTDQAQERARLAAEEKGVAYKEGEAAVTPSQISRPESTLRAGEGVDGTGDGGAPVVTTGDEGEGGESHTEADDTGNGDDENTPVEQIDFEGTSVKDLVEYLTEHGVEVPQGAKQPELAKLAREHYIEDQKRKEEEGEGDNTGEE